MQVTCQALKLAGLAYMLQETERKISHLTNSWQSNIS